MKKKLFFGLTTLVVALTAVGVSACKEEDPPKGCGAFEEYVEYVLNEDGNSYEIQMFTPKEIQDYQSYEEFLSENNHITAITGELIIPATYNGKPVTKVGAYAFASCSITSVILPDSIRSIGFSAFSGCENLMTVTLGTDLQKIGFGAFEDCYRLVEIYNKSSLEITATSTEHGEIGAHAKEVYTDDYQTKLATDADGYVTYTLGEEKSLVNYLGGRFSVYIPEGVTEINAYALAGFDEITNVSLPASLQVINENAFYGCNDLANVYVPSVEAWCNIAFTDYNASPFNYAYRMYVDDDLVVALTIPDGITSLNEYAFYSIESITSVSIPQTLTEIENNAFAWCVNLENVQFPQTLIRIGEYAFTGCKKLKTVTLPNGLERIEKSAFSHSGLTRIELPNSLQTLGEGAFNSCANLAEASLGNTLVYLNRETFLDCEKLERVTIGNSIKSIGPFAFANCFALAEISFPQALEQIGESAFFSCFALTELIILDKTNYIGTGAFEYCEALERIAIGSGLKNVEAYAFYGCGALSEVYYNGTEEDFTRIVVGGNNEPFLNATVYYAE